MAKFESREIVPFREPGWTFLTNHAHVLLCIHRNRNITMRDVARQVGITERATQKIVADLVNDGYLTRQRDGRRNVYSIPSERSFRHPLAAQHHVDELLAIFTRDSPPL